MLRQKKFRFLLVSFVFLVYEYFSNIYCASFDPDTHFIIKLK